MRRAGNTNFFCHRTFPSGSVRRGGLAGHTARLDGDAQKRLRLGRAEILKGNPSKISAGRPPSRAANQGGMRNKQAETAVGYDDPFAESLWLPTPVLPAGPFDLRAFAGRLSTRKVGASRPELPRRSLQLATRERSSRLCVLINPILPGAIHRDHAGEILEKSLLFRGPEQIASFREHTRVKLLWTTSEPTGSRRVN